MTFNNYKQYKQLTKKGQFSDVHLSDLDAGQATNEYMHTIHQLIDLGESSLFVSRCPLWKLQQDMKFKHVKSFFAWVESVQMYPNVEFFGEPCISGYSKVHGSQYISHPMSSPLKIPILGMPISRKP